ncbi:cytochrome P450 [Streptomyces sp. NPDC057617]|uniref:cytochrome P450 n=1 Tax=Streptomyces sp. NPDC057617 TaxID=3346184 RepID=UPI0036C8C14B
MPRDVHGNLHGHVHGDVRTVPRAPGRLPGLGHLPSLFRDPLAFLESLRTYGPVVRVELGTLPVYFVTTADLVREVMVGQARSVTKGRLYGRLSLLAEQSLPVMDGGEVHRRHRRLMQPLFTPARVADYAQVMSRRAGELASRWTAGERILLDHEVADLVMGTSIETMFRSSIGQRVAAGLCRDTRIVSENALLRTLCPPALERLPVVPAVRRFDAAAARMKAVVDEVVAAYRGDGADHNDLLSTLLAARDADTGARLSDAEVRDELVMMLLAGGETCSAATSWVFHELGRDPRTQQRLADELDTVITTREIGRKELERLEFTAWVVDEAQRLHSVPVLTRHTVAPLDLDGLRISPGTELGLSLHALHHDPHTFPDPARFLPDRWRIPPPRHTFVPFGAGGRKCIGDTFGRTQVLIAVATLAARWRFQPAPGHRVRQVFATVPRPDRLPMVLAER